MKNKESNLYISFNLIYLFTLREVKLQNKLSILHAISLRSAIQEVSSNFMQSGYDDSEDLSMRKKVYIYYSKCKLQHS